MSKTGVLKELKIDGILEIGNKDYYVIKKEVIEEVLELIEDTHDIKIAKKRLGKPSVSLKEAKKMLNV